MVFSYAVRFIRSMFSTCGLFRTFKLKYPEVFDNGEYLDTDVHIWLPLFLWWDKQYIKNNDVPYDYIPQTSLNRMGYIKQELMRIEKNKRNHYQRLITSSIIEEGDARHIVDEWYGLKEYILTEEAKKMQELELNHYCQICFERINDTTAVPCGHEFCNQCFLAFPKVDECPFCRNTIERTVLQINEKEYK